MHAIAPCAGMCTHDNAKTATTKGTATERRSQASHPPSRRRVLRGRGREIAPTNEAELSYPDRESFRSTTTRRQKQFFCRNTTTSFPAVLLLHYTKIARNLTPILVVCVSGLAWACVIVQMLGTAASTQEASRQDGDTHGSNTVVIPPETSGFLHDRVMVDSNDPAVFSQNLRIGRDQTNSNHRPGASAPGHASSRNRSSFLGKEAFPAQFAGWDDPQEHEIPVVVNTMDARPLEKSLPKADILLAILSGDTEASRDKRDELRAIYDRYEGWVSVGGKNALGTNKEYLEMSFRMIFIVSDAKAPPEGRLVGDILYVSAPDGYQNIVHKVKHMMGLVRHVDFRYLLKADDDSFVCVKRVASFLHDQPEHVKEKIYAGVPTACNLRTNPNKHIGRVVRNSKDKWYDQKFVHHTLSGLDCFPVYMQGAFYVLAHPLVEYIYRGREHYDTFVNEDVTVGSWLLGVDRVVASMHTIISARLWECVCAGEYLRRESIRKRQAFFHNCKLTSELHKCSDRLQRPTQVC